jgi:hypothetical protein
MMYDHGCDSVAVLLGSVNVSYLFGLGFGVEAWVVYCMTMMAFYFGNLEASRLR